MIALNKRCIEKKSEVTSHINIVEKLYRKPILYFRVESMFVLTYNQNIILLFSSKYIFRIKQTAPSDRRHGAA